MPVTSVEKDLDHLTITIVADFTAPLRRLWDAYTDPRQLERFWGPPTYPATFLRHDAVTGGRSVYVMTGPEGDTHYGCWEWTSTDAPAHSQCSTDLQTKPASPTPISRPREWISHSRRRPTAAD